jgi:hypothetical protein
MAFTSLQKKQKPTNVYWHNVMFQLYITKIPSLLIYIMGFTKSSDSSLRNGIF